MSVYLERKKAEMAPLYEQVKTLESLEDRSETQQAEYDTLITQLDNRLEEFQRVEAQETKSISFGDRLSSLAVPRPRAHRDGPPSEGRTEPLPRRLSDRVLESAEYKANMMIGQNPIDLGSDLVHHIMARGAAELKAAWVPTNLAAAGGPLEVFGPNTPRRAHPLLAAIPTTPWGGLAVPYLSPTFTNNAAIVAMGQPKPESTNAGNVLSAVMQTIAHWKDVPRQLLRYVNGIRQVLDDELIGGVEDELEDEIINGDGTTGHFLGLITAVTQAGSGADLVTATLSGIGLVAAAGGTVDGVVMNSGDVWSLMGLAYTNNKYLPIVAGGRFMGIPILPTSKLATGKTIVGDFSRGARLYDGEAANVRAVEPGAKSNLVTLIGEVDAVFIVAKPSYFAENTAPLVAP